MRTRLLVAVCLLVTAGCTSTHEEAATPRRVIVHGTGQLDGQPFDSDFVGAAVLADGLVTACQGELPPVKAGAYSVPVLAEPQAVGCGRPGRKVVLWTFAGNQIIHSTNTLDWPTGDRVSFAPKFDSSSPNGAAPEAANFVGGVYQRDGEPAPIGTKVEAFVDDVRCGVASVRRSDAFVGYVIAVVGPDSVPGCTRDASVTFRVNGKPAHHDPVANRVPGVQDNVDLRL